MNRALYSTLLAAEIKRLRGDAFLLLMLALMPLVALTLNALWPALTERWPHWDLPRLKPAISALLAVLTPLVMGLVLGFQCLAEREAGMLAAVRLTPSGLGRYLGVRLAAYAAVGLLVTLLVHQWLGLVSLSVAAVTAVAILALPLLPFAMLILLSFARSQVEGFAIMKATGGLVSIPIILLLFVPAPWHWLASPLPTWWTLLGYFKLAEGDAGGWGWMSLGAVVLLMLDLWLARRLLRRSD